MQMSTKKISLEYLSELSLPKQEVLKEKESHRGLRKNEVSEKLEVKNQIVQKLSNETTKVMPKHTKSKRKCSIKRCIFLIFLILLSSILITSVTLTGSEIPSYLVDDFSLFVYCPYSYKQKASLLLSNHERVKMSSKILYSTYSISVKLLSPQNVPNHDWSHTYVVQMQSRLNETGGVQLYYCGLVTFFGSSCDEKVFQACSTPGPIFDLNVSQHADIIWINNLDEQTFIRSNCMTIDSKDPHCRLMKSSSRIRTFVDPTDEHHNEMTQITPNKWPTAPHIHGAEVRPTFDGNPLSWIANDGSRGVGVFSFTDTCYYAAFDQNEAQKNIWNSPELIFKRISENENKNIVSQAKVNRYLNLQNPGNLWYHDHAMKLTQYNVQYGLAGMYILRDPIVEAQIGVNIKNEKIVIMTTSGWKTTQILEANSEVIYRFKFLNNHFGSTIYRIFFTYESCSTATTFVPFTIIGADSSLFNQGIYNQTSFIIAQAERMEILIKFDGSQKSYSICSPPPSNPFPPVPKILPKMTVHQSILYDSFEAIKLLKGDKKKNDSLNNRKDIAPVVLSVPFVDFNDSKISINVKRMRPLMKINGVYSINGRLSFHSGKSENPTIGTYEDWYMINVMTSTHPMHFHLINFQVIKILTLRKTSGGCTLYELDFLIEAIKAESDTSFMKDVKYFPDQNDLRNVNYNTLCMDMETLYKSDQIIEKLDLVNVENVVDDDGISGIDVEKPLTLQQIDLLMSLNISIAPGQNLKYVTNEDNFIKPYYRRWKDSVSVDGGKVSVLRIRWAKPSYKGGNDTYFNVPIDQLREYPGFVYHCHFLSHEDNEMMRPIMLQLPEEAKLNPQTPCNNLSDYSWAYKVKCINQRCKKA